jgi:PAS domain S-box-containing protein
MVEALTELVAFTLVPGTALLLGVLYSLREIYRIGETRIAIILLILGFMLFHQTTELSYFLDTGAFRDPVGGEIPETSANLIAAGSVSYVLALLCKERELREDLEASRAEIRTVKDRLELIFENVNDGILLIDPDDETIVEANRTAYDLLRYEPGELEGISPYDLHPHEPELFDELTDVLRPDGGVVSEKLSCRRRDGSLMPAAVSASRTELDGTDVLLVTIRDNTEREQYRSQADLLTRVLRHNLRNDINIVTGYLNAIRDGIEDPRLRELADKSLEKCHTLVELSDQTRQLNEILDIEYDKVSVVTDLVPLVERVVDSYREEFPKARIETELPETAIVEASENVRWAIENLIENAIVHADSEPQVQVYIEQDTIKAEGLHSEWVTLTVADHGPGIPESEVTVLDDEMSRTQTQHGSGLGLWIVKQIAQIFDGYLEIDRDPASAFSTEVSLRLQPGTNGYAVEADSDHSRT